MTTTDDDDPVILQFYSNDKRRRVFVVPRKAATIFKNQHPGARVHIWEVQKGLEFPALALVKPK